MVEEEGQQFADERREIEQPMELPADERQEQGHQRWPVGRPAHERQPVGRPARESQHVAGPVGRPARPVEQPMESSTDERQEQGQQRRRLRPAERPVGQRRSRRRPSPPVRSFEEEDPMFEGNLQACPLSEKDKPIKKGRFVASGVSGTGLM